MAHEIWMAPGMADAYRAFDGFIASFQAKHPKACECLTKDRAELLAFYNVPAEHWQHIRTTNHIESTLATVRHRTRKTKVSGSRAACLAMVYRLMQSASHEWRVLNGSHLIAQLIEGVAFTDGVIRSQAA